ncbi:MAG: c-type cytochrome [Verrucomicrobiales bacterium]
MYRSRATFLLLPACLCLAATTLGAAPPNVIIVLSDDQGYPELSAHGNPVLKTPNLDRLHGESIRFTAGKKVTTIEPEQDLAKMRQRANESFQALRVRGIRKLDVGKSLTLLAASLAESEETTVRAALLRGMLSGLAGRRNIPAPAGWSEVSVALMESSEAEIRQMALRLGQIFGDLAATEKALAILRDPVAPVEDRRLALQSLLTQQNKEVGEALESLLQDPEMRLDAIRAYASASHPGAPRILLARYPGFDETQRRAIIETLATRKEYARQLLAALKRGEIAREAIPAYVARSLAILLGRDFTDVYGDLAALSADKEALIANYQGMITPAALSRAKASRGRILFEQVCAACHVIYGNGGIIGPDLTGSNRADLDYILLNILDPSGDIPDAYKMVVVTTRTGQVLAGTVTGEDDQKLVLSMVGQQSVVLKSDIASREISPSSMMPEGLLLGLSKDQVLDLIKYLRTTTQVALPKKPTP